MTYVNDTTISPVTQAQNLMISSPKPNQLLSLRSFWNLSHMFSNFSFLLPHSSGLGNFLHGQSIYTSTREKPFQSVYSQWHLLAPLNKLPFPTTAHEIKYKLTLAQHVRIFFIWPQLEFSALFSSTLLSSHIYLMCKDKWFVPSPNRSHDPDS